MKKQSSIFYLNSLYFSPLLVAALIYVVFRSPETLINVFLQNTAHINFHVKNSFLPEWVIYSLPGALWLMSFQLVYTINSSATFKRKTLNVLLFLGIALGIEIAQGLHITDGVFDIIDIAAYTMATIISLITIIRINHKKCKAQSLFNAKWLFFLFVGIVILSDIYNY